MVAGGDSLVAHPRGCRPRSGMSPGYQAGVPPSLWRPGAPACSGTGARRRRRYGTVERCCTRPPPGTIPDAPGSYQFVDAEGRVLYVGKAKSLRSRLTNYFADPATLPARTAQMVAQADHVEWIQVGNEVEAILLEYTLIKRAPAPIQHPPRRTTSATRRWR